MAAHLRTPEWNSFREIKELELSKLYDRSSEVGDLIFDSDYVSHFSWSGFCISVGVAIALMITIYILWRKGVLRGREHRSRKDHTEGTDSPESGEGDRVNELENLQQHGESSNFVFPVVRLMP
jgi:hypothetical protein